MSLYTEWLQAKADETAARMRRIEIEGQIVAQHDLPPTHEGTYTTHDDGYTVKITGRMTRKVDMSKAMEIAEEHGLNDQMMRLFKWRIDVDKAAWRATDPSITEPLLAAIETRPGKPAVTITQEN